MSRGRPRGFVGECGERRRYFQKPPCHGFFPPFASAGVQFSKLTAFASADAWLLALRFRAEDLNSLQREERTEGKSRKRDLPMI